MGTVITTRNRSNECAPFSASSAMEPRKNLLTAPSPWWFAQHFDSASPSLPSLSYPMRFWPALSIKEDKPGNATAGPVLLTSSKKERHMLLMLRFSVKSAWLTTVCDGQRSLN